MLLCGRQGNPGGRQCGPNPTSRRSKAARSSVVRSSEHVPGSLSSADTSTLSTAKLVERGNDAIFLRRTSPSRNHHASFALARYLGRGRTALYVHTVVRTHPFPKPLEPATGCISSAAFPAVSRPLRGTTEDCGRHGRIWRARAHTHAHNYITAYLKTNARRESSRQIRSRNAIYINMLH